MSFECGALCAVFFWAHELVFTEFTRTKTVPKHSRELVITSSELEKN